MPGRVQKLVVRILCLFVVSVGWTSLGAQTAVPGDNSQPPATQNDKASPAGPIANSNTKLGAGDLIEVSVFGVPDLATKTRVSSAGDVYLPLIDYVHVADLTTDEAQELIQKRLEDGGFVRNPHVSIYVNESASQAITILGEVAHPGAYAAIGDRKLYDMLSLAGGLTERAGGAVAIMHRGDPDHKVELQLPRSLTEDTSHNVDIEPGDTIIVSKAGIIYVVGAVNRPSGFLVQEDTMTVLKALALAGGSTRTSSLNKTMILRQTPNALVQIPVTLKKVLHAKAPDVPLQKGDVLFIPGSAAKSAAYRSADAAFSMTTALGVVAAHP